MARAELFLLKTNQIFAGSHQVVVIAGLHKILHMLFDTT